MSISMEQIGGPVKKARWTFEITDELATLVDPNGKRRETFTMQEGLEQIVLPSFSENIRFVSIPCDGHQLTLYLKRHALGELKRFLRGGLAELGPEVVDAMKRRAVRDTAIGASAALAGIGITVASFRAQNEASGVQVFYGLVVFGLFMMGKGIHGFIECRKTQARIDEKLRLGNDVAGRIDASREQQRKCA